jgi:hypothetical protein
MEAYKELLAKQPLMAGQRTAVNLAAGSLVGGICCPRAWTIRLAYVA